MSMDPKLHNYSREKTVLFLSQLRERTTAIPGVRSVSFTGVVPLSIGAWNGDFHAPATKDHAQQTATADINSIGTGYFETMGIPLLRGRDFNLQTDDKHLVIINEAMAHQYFGGVSALGQRINGKLVVGVARNTKYTSLREPPPRMMYTPVGSGWAVADVRFALHSNRTIAELTDPVKRAIVDAGVTQPVTAIESLGAIADLTLARERLHSSRNKSWKLSTGPESRYCLVRKTPKR